MSQPSNTEVRGAVPGPYGPGNPPPPPPGSPPSKADCKRGRDGNFYPLPSPQESFPAKKFERPYRKLSNRQRKARKQKIEKAKVDQGLSRCQSRQPVSRDDQRSQMRYRDELAETDDRDEDCLKRTSFGGSQDRRQPLKDARQFTPNHILDETHGRLSPSLNNQDHYQPADGNMRGRPVARNDWSEDQTWSPGANVDQRFGQSLHGPSGWDEDNVPPFEKVRPGHGEGRTRYERPNNTASLPLAVASRAFDVEDELDWSDHGPAGTLEPNLMSAKSNFGGLEPQHVAQQSLAAPPKWHSKKRALSPPRDERPWQHRPWKGSDHRPLWKMDTQPSWKENDRSVSMGEQNHQPQYQKAPTTWGGHPNQRPLEAKYEKPRPQNFDDPSHMGMTSFEKPCLAVKSREALLAPDPALIQGSLVLDNVYDLRKYDGHITALHKGLPKQERYINGNGKVAPYLYGSIQGKDLGLCFSTFCTSFKCEMGVKCAWRHHPLTRDEREWILACGGFRGKQFLEKLAQYWAVPDIPVPGASMYDK